MGFIKKNMLSIGIVAVAVGGLWLYMTYFSGDGGAALTTEAPESPLSQDVLVTLSNLNTLKLDNSIFSDPLFISLSDFSVAIPAQNAGRRNPFAPI